MKIELEQKDIEAIAKGVAELLIPIIAKNEDMNIKDKIFTVKKLSEYLGLSVSWIYNNMHKIPHFNKKEDGLKKGKPLFRKSEIDQWLEDFKNEPKTNSLPIFRRQNKG